MQESTKNAVKQVIASSKWILELNQNWDDENSEGYSLATFDKAVYILWKIAQTVDDYSLRNPLPLPKLAPANEGSIDLSWDLDDCKLLVNVSSTENGFATYYGENDRGETISGKIAIAQGVSIKILGDWLS